MGKSGGWLKSLFGGDGGKEEVAIKPPREEHAGRRSSKRVPAPVGLFYFIPPDRFVTLKLCVYRDRDDADSAIDCFLFDVNSEGLGFACAEQLEPGAHVYIRGHLADDLDPLVDAEVEILDCRPFPAERPCPSSFQGKELQVYGARIDMQQAMILLKTTLDCVAMHIEMTRKAGGADHSGSDADGEPAVFPGSQVEEPPEEQSFGSLPVAGVEIVEDEIRRCSARDRLEVPLRFVDEEDKLHDVRLTARIGAGGDVTTLVAELFDFSPEGACVIIGRRIEPGLDLELRGECAETGEELFLNRYVIRNRRERKIAREQGDGDNLEYTFGAQVEASLETVHDVVFSYGLEIVEGEDHLVFKAALDSVYHAHRVDGAGSDDEGEA